MNNLTITGRLTADAVYTPAGNGSNSSRATFTVAVTNPRDSKKSDFFNCVAWGNKAEFVNKGFAQGRYRKGCEAEVSGHVHLNEYQTQNGEKRSNLELYADNTYSKVHPDFSVQQGGQAYGAQPGYGQQGYQAPPAQQAGSRQGYPPAQQYGYPQGNQTQTGAPSQAAQNGNRYGTYPMAANGQTYVPAPPAPAGGFIPSGYQG